VLAYDTRQDITALQQEDLLKFGRLVFALCCNNLAAMNNAPKALETLGRQYSSDMKNVALFLISPGPHKVRGSQITLIPVSFIAFLCELEHWSAIRFDRQSASHRNG
jgi:PAB-dependent poly(A)-specific ribonuclease subunit 3